MSDTDRDEHVRQIRERRHAATLPANQRGLLHTASWVDIDYLLSLLDSQVAQLDTLQWSGNPPTTEGYYWYRWQGQLTMYYFFGGQLFGMLSAEGQHPPLFDAEWLGPIKPTSISDAAIRVRDRCVEKVRELRDSYKGSRNTDYDYGFFDGLNSIETALESLTLEQGEQEKL